METRPDSPFDTALRDALRAGYLRAPWPAEAGAGQASEAAPSGPSTAAPRTPAAAAVGDDPAGADWADVLIRAQQPRPLAHAGGSVPVEAAANDAPPRRAGDSPWQRRVVGACIAVVLAGVVWWQVPPSEPLPGGDGVAPSAVAEPPGIPRGVSSTGSQATASPLVQVDDPAREARRWAADLGRLGAVVHTASGAGANDLTLHIAVADEARRMAVNTWLAAFDQQLDGQGRLTVRMSAHR